MDYSQIITADNLEEYANTRESQSGIPELIYLLVKESIPDSSICRIPYGDYINQPGFDGIVESKIAFREFVPQGKSYWEIGVGGDPEEKASGDFKKRTINKVTKLSQTEIVDSTFVFITPRFKNWDERKQSKWIDKRRKKWKWKDIRILDGIKLADWLREFPALGRWMSKKLNFSKTLCGFNTPAELWELIQERVKAFDCPPLPPRIFIESRETACIALHALFQGEKNTLLLAAESPEDVEEFVSGFLASLDEATCNSYRNRCLFISEEEAWHSFVQKRKSHVLVADPRLELDSVNSNLLTIATQKGHAVVIPICGALLGDRTEIIKLRSPSQAKLENILLEAGYSSVRAKELAMAGADRLSALKRFLLGFEAIPPYAKWDNARFLAQALLIGKWDNKNEADQTVMEFLSGKSHGEWIEILKPELHRSDTPLVQHNEKWRIVARGEAWNALGSYLMDDDLDRLLQIALQVLGERDPKFDLPKNNRFAANIKGIELKHSQNLREGIAETLALLGSRPDALSSCSQGKANNIAILAVRRLLESAEWDRWASIDYFLPLLAEAAPNEFLIAVESALDNLDESPFHKVFAQEDNSALGGWNYTSGLLWALETLAWNPDYFARVILLLGALSSIDPGGNWANRPSNSLTHILLPWHIQTCAPIEKRKKAIEVLLQEYPEVGWKLLLTLLPYNYGTTFECRRPRWRNFIPIDWTETVTKKEYWNQITIYADIAIGVAKSRIDKLKVLIDRLSDLPMPAFNELLTYLASEMITSLPETERTLIWEALNNLVRKHRKFADASWAMPKEIVDKIEVITNLLAPKDPKFRYHHLFNVRDFDLFEKKLDYIEQQKQLNQLRQNAIQEILDSIGIVGVLEFAQNVSLPYQVGYALGYIPTDSIESELLPSLLENKDDVQKILIKGFVWARFSKFSWPWVDKLLAMKWSITQQVSFLVLLPFVEEVWTRVEKHLGLNEGLYWNKAIVNPWDAQNHMKSIEKLIKYDRPNAALQCIWSSINKKSSFDTDLATRILLAIIDSKNFEKEFDPHATIEVITRIQECPSFNRDDLIKIEWILLPLLNKFSSGSPKTLENYLASNADFFCELISLVFRSKNEEKNEREGEEEPTKKKKNQIRNAYKLLNQWKIPPGIQPNGSFDPVSFSAWLTKVNQNSKKTGHLDIALSQLGHVLTYVPPDPNGLWIHQAVAKVLNSKDARSMREGFIIELFNSRGVHGFTAGKTEYELAQEYNIKAEALEAKGFYRFATSVRELAKNYEQDAKKEALREPFED